MNEIISLTKRNVKIFVRDKTSVFFSFLSVIIFIFIFSFISNTFKTDELRSLLSENEITFLVNALMMGGVLVLNTSNLALGNLGNLVEDFENHTIEAFLVTPVKRGKIVVSYYLSSFIITTIFSLVLWGLAIIVFGLMSQIFFSFEVIFITTLLIILFVFISVAFMLLLTTFVKSINAFGAVAGIFGTLIGFLSGIYMPLSILPKFMVSVASFIPYTHMTILLKQVLLRQSLAMMGTENMSAEQIKAMNISLGIHEIGILGFSVPMYLIIIVTVALSIVALVIATIRLQKRIKN